MKYWNCIYDNAVHESVLIPPLVAEQGVSAPSHINESVMSLNQGCIVLSFVTGSYWFAASSVW